MSTWKSERACMDCHKQRVYLQQTTQRTFGSTWILRTAPHTRPLETCQSPRLVQLMCTWLWNQIYWMRAPSTPIQCATKGNIQNCWRFGRWPLLRHCPKLELCKTPCQSCYGKMCYETAHKIWSRCTFETITPAHTCQVPSSMEKTTKHLPHSMTAPTGCSRKETSPTNFRQLPILCTGSGFYYINGTIWNIITTKCPVRKHNEMGQPVSWLHVDTSRCNHPVPCICSRAGGYFFLGSLLCDGDPIKSLTGPFMSRAPSSSWLLHRQQKPNWGHSSWMHKKQTYFGLSLPNLDSDIHKHLHQYTLTTQPHPVL